MTKIYLLLLLLSAWPVLGQTTIPNSLIKLSKTLESKNISSQIVTKNAKTVNVPKRKKIKTKKDQEKKTPLNEVVLIPTKNVPLNDDALIDESIELLAQDVELALSNELSQPTTNRQISNPWIRLGLSFNHLPLPKSRINPSSTISSWLALAIEVPFLELSGGYTAYSENDVGGSPVAYAQTSTTSYYAQLVGRYPIKNNVWLMAGYLIIKTDGTLAYAQLNKATIDGFYIGLKHESITDLSFSIGWFPKLNNRYQLDNISPAHIKLPFQPSTSFNTSIDYSAFVFSIKYDFFSF